MFHNYNRFTEITAKDQQRIHQNLLSPYEHLYPVVIAALRMQADCQASRAHGQHSRINSTSKPLPGLPASAPTSLSEEFSLNCLITLLIKFKLSTFLSHYNNFSYSVADLE
jgi:hypothetical protein